MAEVCWGVCIMSDLPEGKGREGKGRLKAGCSCLADLVPFVTWLHE